MAPMETRQAEGVPFAVLNPSDLKNPKMGTTNAQNLDAPEIHVVHPLRGRKKSLNSMMNFSNHSKNGRDIPQKTPAKRKRTLSENCFCGMTVLNLRSSSSLYPYK